MFQIILISSLNYKMRYLIEGFGFFVIPAFGNKNHAL